MRASTRREFVAGPAGRIECAVDKPKGKARGVALIAHPHPLFGGSLDNKVVQTLARTFVDFGYETWRPNFRGVGETEGVHDEGRGELEDLQAVLRATGAKKYILAGFSFGAVMAARLAASLGKEAAAEWLVLVGIGITRLDAPPVPEGTLLIHGETDDVVPLAAVFDWARPQELPVVVIPGAEHFYHGKLQVLRRVVEANRP